MGHILQHAAEHTTVRRLAEMLASLKDEYKTNESYTLFSTIVCWMTERARAPFNRDNLANRQAHEVGIALQDSRIKDAA